ncbi:unnamed protein product [Schistosoma mattheei]|uniref:Uncharacterized protein n=1 Tax=Schistosoma mattheei TaxID=31246 RepID=A0AA85BKQ3_9TREM|nr:unnamed protein product [Schistosoma mattheei]
MKVVYIIRKLTVNFIFQLFVNSITLCATYGQIQMELTDSNGMNSGMGYTNVVPGDSIQVTQMGPNAIAASDSSQVPTPVQSTVSPASSVVGIFPSYRPQYGFPGYFPTVSPGKGIVPGISSPSDNIIVASFPGGTPSVTQPGNVGFPGGALPVTPGVKSGSSVSPTATLTQQTVESVLSYLALHHPEIFRKYLYPKPYQRPYIGGVKSVGSFCTSIYQVSQS